LGYISDAFVAFALIGLGVQLAEVKFGRKMGKVMLVSTIKVIIAPLTGFALALLLNIHGILGAALIIGLSTPSAVNSATFALEFGNEPEFAAQVVFMTTVLCTFSLPLVIYFVRGYFGVA
jgi:predicted permease